ncbi:DUF6153 family protein [Nocardia sp. NPDC050175]|uniref:DUF6153 family protein n=1 Tax=Nocardia sp. NPDC050175 TaxID=3364317 RepID=UPI00378CA6B3
MVEQHPPLRATGLAPALGVLVLLAGIVAMHAAVFAMHGQKDAAIPDHTAMAMPTVVDQFATMPDADHGAPGADCAGDGCGGTHGGMHGCVFILAATALLLALVLLYRITVARPGNGVARLRHWRPRRERSPPWTVLSLAELSILRI